MRRNRPRKISKTCVVMSVSGTGGHVFPLLALVEVLRPKMELHIVIEQGDLINRERFNDLGCQVYEIDAGKLRRYHGRGAWYFFHPTNIRENTRDMWRLVKGIFQSLRLLHRLRPQVVFVKGGYVGVPVGLAAALLGLRLVTHDSDTVPSLTNRTLARWASRIAVGFPREYYNYPSRKLVYTGIPLRKSFVRTVTPKKVARARPLIVVVGGSQGSRRLNSLIFTNLEALTKQARIVHITGVIDIALARRHEHRLGKSRYGAFEFVTKQYPTLIKSADLVICRAGATTVAECAVAGTPMVVIPNTYLTEGHQIRNAEALAEASAAVVLEEERVVQQPAHLIDAVTSLLSDNQRLTWQRRNAAALFPADATERIASLILRVAHGSAKE